MIDKVDRVDYFYLIIGVSDSMNGGAMTLLKKAVGKGHSKAREIVGG